MSGAALRMWVPVLAVFVSSMVDKLQFFSSRFACWRSHLDRRSNLHGGYGVQYTANQSLAAARGSLGAFF